MILRCAHQRYARASIGRSSYLRRVDVQRRVSPTWKPQCLYSTSQVARESVVPGPRHAGSDIPPECYDKQRQFPSPSFAARTVPLDAGSSINLDTTRAAAIEFPPPPAQNHNQALPLRVRVEYYYKIGKAFLSFYKTGLLNVWHNRKTLRSINRKVPARQLDSIAKYSAQVRGSSQTRSISRAEYQLALRTRHDIFKLIPFSLVFLVCGEFTPLVILALGSRIVPYTCRIPRQTIKDIRIAVERDNHYKQDLITYLKSNGNLPDWKQQWLSAYHYNVTRFRSPLPVVGRLYFLALIRPYLIKKCDQILTDTILIAREGGFDRLPNRDLYEWADTYSLAAVRTHQRSALKDHDLAENQKLDVLWDNNMRKLVLPAAKREASYILDQDWATLRPSEHWRAACQGPRSAGSPDYQARTRPVATENQDATEKKQ